MSHTPGPWRVAGAILVAPDYGQTAIAEAIEVQGFPGWETRRANARLIAAAPELLEMLKSVSNILFTSRDWVSCELEHKATALIAKAEGRT